MPTRLPAEIREPDGPIGSVGPQLRPHRNVPRDYKAVQDHDRAEDVAWRATLSGEAMVVDGALFVVDGSTQASVRDTPQQPTQR